MSSGYAAKHLSHYELQKTGGDGWREAGLFSLRHMNTFISFTLSPFFFGSETKTTRNFFILNHVLCIIIVNIVIQFIIYQFRTNINNYISNLQTPKPRKDDDDVDVDDDDDGEDDDNNVPWMGSLKSSMTHEKKKEQRWNVFFYKKFNRDALLFMKYIQPIRIREKYDEYIKKRETPRH